MVFAVTAAGRGVDDVQWTTALKIPRIVCVTQIRCRHRYVLHGGVGRRYTQEQNEEPKRFVHVDHPRMSLDKPCEINFGVQIRNFPCQSAMSPGDAGGFTWPMHRLGTPWNINAIDDALQKVKGPGIGCAGLCRRWQRKIVSR